MKLSYYPGCTLKTKARNLEQSAIAAMAALGVELVELPRWNCCGAVYTFAEDDLVHHLAPIRNLIRVKEQGQDKVVTLCDFCYNTLRRANLVVQKDPVKRDTLNTFMEEEIDYDGKVEVLHLVQVLRDLVGWKTVAEKVKMPLKGLRVAPYYGCTLLRPREIAVDNVERPTFLHDLVRAVGAEAVNFPFSTECCGGFQAVGNPDYVLQCTQNILASAARAKADAIVVSCPLCNYNLGRRQDELIARLADFSEIPVLYFTELLALALGLEVGPSLATDYRDARPLLRRKGLVA